MELSASQPKNAVIDEAVRALECRDWDALKPLLHPYLRWTLGSGRTIRGRAQVLAQLRVADEITPPRLHELRDGQIYRWLQDAKVE